MAYRLPAMMASSSSGQERSMKALRIATPEQVTLGLSSYGLQPTDKTAAVTRVRVLERQLFDDSGHLRRGVTPERADETVALINNLRRALGWLEIDLDGRWRWPDNRMARACCDKS
jgi:hypothetical protein